MDFPSSSAILELISRISGGGAAAVDNLLARLVPKDSEQDSHDDTAGDAETQDPNHGKVALAVLVRSLDSILRPSRVQCIGSRDASQVAETGHESRSSRHSDLTMASLEDFVGPGHADRNGWAESESNHEQTTVSSPRVCQGKSNREQAGNLDTNSSREEQSAVFVEPIRNRGNQEDCTKVHL